MRIRELLFALLFFYKENLLFLFRFCAGQGRRRAPVKNFGVNLAGYLSTESGVGEASRCIAKMLEKSSVPFALNNIGQQWLRSGDTTYSSLYTRDNPYTINILHVNADMVPYVANRLGMEWFKGRYSIGYWYWELEKFPSKWDAAFRCFNEIWVASDFCRKAIAERSPVPVIKISPAVEAPLSQGYSKGYFNLNESTFMFLCVFDFMSHFERKNPLAVIEAFRKVFRKYSANDVVLVLKFVNSEKNKTAAHVLLKAAESLPIRVIDFYISRDHLYGLISAADCYVALHRSEGFGLPIAEAMYLGKPVIATGYSGNMEFMHSENSFPVRYTMKKISSTSGPYKKGNYWADPDIDHAAEFMKHVFEDRRMAQEVGMKASDYIKNNFSPEAAGRFLQERLRAIYNKY